jgi:hypothetical protein
MDFEWNQAKSKGRVRHAKEGVSQRIRNTHGRSVKSREGYYHTKRNVDTGTSKGGEFSGTMMYSKKDMRKIEKTRLVPVTAIDPEARGSTKSKLQMTNTIEQELRELAEEGGGKVSKSNEMCQRGGRMASVNIRGDREVKGFDLSHTTEYELKTVGYIKETRSKPVVPIGQVNRHNQHVISFTASDGAAVTVRKPEPNTLYYIDSSMRAPRVLQRVDTNPPLNVRQHVRLQHKSLTLHARTAKNSHYRKAWTWNDNHADCWLAASENDDKEALEVDLGAECDVSAISTKGQFPHTWAWSSQFPNERRPSSFRGSAYHVPTSLKHSRKNVSLGQWDEGGSWVQRYEVLGRREGGRKWFSIGRFRGNSDSTTEVAHSFRLLADAGKEGLVLRYLRFRPLSMAEEGYHKWKAMRVCVFGKRMDGEEGGGVASGEGPQELQLDAREQQQRNQRGSVPRRRKKGKGKGARAATEVAGLGVPESVTYKVTKYDESANRKYVAYGSRAYKSTWDQEGRGELRKREEAHIKELVRNAT